MQLYHSVLYGFKESCKIIAVKQILMMKCPAPLLCYPFWCLPITSRRLQPFIPFLICGSTGIRRIVAGSIEKREQSSSLFAGDQQREIKLRQRQVSTNNVIVEVHSCISKNSVENTCTVCLKWLCLSYLKYCDIS